MKKLIALAMFLAAGVASAQSFVSVEGQYADSLSGNNQAGTAFTVGTKATNNLVVDLKSEFLNTESTNTQTNRLEAGATGLVPMGPVTGYVRGSYGAKFTDGNRFDYYSVEPGVRAALGTGTVKLGYRYRTALDSVNADTTRTWRVGYSHPLNKTIDLGVGYEASRGDIRYNGYLLGLTAKF